MTSSLLRSIAAAALVLAGTSSKAAAQAVAPPPVTLTLDAAMQYALDHYPTVKGALEQANAAAAGVGAAKAAYLPSLDAVWQINRATANNVFGQVLPQAVIPSMSGPVLPAATSDSVWGSAVGALFTWNALDFGLRDAFLKEATAGEDRARADEAVTRLAVQGSVGAAFLDVASAEASVAAADADVARRDALARAARVLADNQLRPGAEVSRADAERAAAQTRAIRARQSVAVARAAFIRLLGMQTGTASVDTARLLETVPAQMGAPPTPAAHPVVLARQAAANLVRSREAALQKSDRPHLLLQSALFARGTGASPDGGFAGGADGLWFDRTNWAAGIQVVFPNVFDASSLHARQAAAIADSHIEDAKREEAVLDITSQQQSAAAILEGAIAILQNTPVQLASARQSETQARARYDAGLASILEVAEAQSLLAAAEYEDSIARLDVWRALLGQAVARGDLTPFIERVRAAGAP